MFRRKFIDRLRNKYRTGGKLQDPYLTIGGRSINTDNGTRYGAGAKLSAPILESIRRGSDASGLRFETDFAGTNSGPVSISNDEGGKAYNASLGLRGYHNKYINRNNTLSLNSNIGAGIGTGDENGDGQMNPFVDANLSLLKSGRTRKGTNVSGGPTLSYGTEGSPNQGLRLGLEGNYGRLSGNVEYDITNKSPRIGASLNFQEGGVRKFHEGGTADQEHMDMMNMGTLDAHNAEGNTGNTGNTDTGMYGNPDVNPDGTPKIDYGLSVGTEGIRPIISGDGAKQIGKWGKGVWDKSSNLGKAGIVASGVAAPIAALGAGLDPRKLFKEGGMYNQMKQYRGGGANTSAELSMPMELPAGPRAVNAIPSNIRRSIDRSTLNKIDNKGDAYNQKLIDEIDRIKSSLYKGNVTGLKSGVNWFNNFDASRLKSLRDEGGIGKKELRSAVHDAVGSMGYDNWGARQAISLAMGSKGLRDGGTRDNIESMEYSTGGQQLPGGEMQPIPGSDAMQFNGQSHDQGGIMLDSKTEVEGGETMDQVAMAKNGGKRSDYFFSDHLKKGGVSYAEMHKDILAEGGDQEKINYLAQMQEKAAGRPSGSVQTAENGGIKQYVTGGESYLDQLKRQINERNTTVPLMLQGKEYPLVNGKEMNQRQKDFHDKQISSGKVFKDGAYTNPARTVTPKTASTKYTSPFTTQDEEREFQDWANANNYNTKGYGWGKLSQDAYDKGFADFQASKIVPETEEEVVEVEELSLQEKNINDRRMKSPDVDQRIYDNLQLRIDRGDILTDKQQADYDRVVLALGEDRTTDNYVRRNQRKEFDNLQDEANNIKDTPRLAMIAGAAQLAPAAYAMFNKQPAAEQATYTQGFTSPIIAERGKSAKLERVNFNNERSTNASDMRGLNRFIETSGGGPANIINKMMSYSKKQQGDSRINAAETRANQQIANQEAQMEQQMAVNNMTRAQQASTTNAQLSRAETARMDQIGVTNAAARQKVKDDEEFMKYQGVSATASGVGGLLGDMMSYKAQERMARTIGTEGIYKRDQLRTLYKKQNPNATEADVNAFITQYNS
tara:strand:+ start:1028 stop:4219 length:3192 start_codon:yes stop_codon:yes gene_type:complete